MFKRQAINMAVLLLVFFLGMPVCESPAALSGLDKSLDYKDWELLSDSGWPGGSTGYVESIDERGQGVRFKYALKATMLWPWPEIDFYLEYSEIRDFSGYKGAKLRLKGDKKQEIYFYFLTKDKNTGVFKPCWQRLVLSDTYQSIYLPFEQFKIAKDWMPRNPGFNSDIEWDAVKTFGFHKKGVDGEEGSLELVQIEFIEQEPEDLQALDLEGLRSLPPRHFSINLENNVKMQSIDAKITVFTEAQDKEQNQISPYIYGANWGVWLGLPDEKKVASLGLKLIRAGGPFMDRANWRNNKYTFPATKVSLSMTDLDHFIHYCKRVGAEPLIQINALGFAPDDKNRSVFSKCIGPEDAADLVRYLNREKGYNVRFFEIGNEPFIWHRVHFDVRLMPCSIEEYFGIFKDISLAMKKTQSEINPRLQLKIFAPGVSTSYLNWETLSLNTEGTHAIKYFLQECRKFQYDKSANPLGFRILDVLSFHLFPSFRDEQTGQVERDISSILRSTQTWWNKDYTNELDRSLPLGAQAAVIPKFKRWVLEDYPGTELAVTEFNLEAQSMIEYDPVIKVLYLADLYGIMAVQGMDYAAQFCLNSSDHHIALMDEADNITPLYYPLSLYAKYFNSQSLEAVSTLPEKLNVYACDNGEKIVLMVVNKQSQVYETQVILSKNREDENPTIFSYSFPPLSLTCLRVSRKGIAKDIDCWEYGVRQIDRTISSDTNL